ncbi:MAG: HU family DNA-binding protein [Planctomycetota bacterium]
MATITKKELIYRISEKSGQKKIVTKNIIQAFIDEIIDELGKGNRLEFREFGVFELKDRAARKARNPRTGESVQVPAKKVVHFKAGRLMKEKIHASTEAAEQARNNGSVRDTGSEGSPPSRPSTEPPSIS